MRVFLLGAGYSARQFARLIGNEANAIAGTTRFPDNFATLQQAGIEPVIFNDESSDTPPAALAARLAEASHIVISIPPRDGGVRLTSLVEQALAIPGNKIAWIGYLSTVGVYGDHGGNAVDENTPCKPVSRRSLERLQDEQAWTLIGEKYQVPVALLRLSGIYGPGRNAFINLQNGTARRINKPGQVFNRIHVDDIAGALRLLASEKLGGIFNVSDNEPAPPQDVVAFAADIMGVTPPAETAFIDADLSPMARSFYGENKRVSNERLREAGYQFIYPDYRHAFTQMWQDKSWR